LNVTKFKPTKSQKKVLRRFDRNASTILPVQDGKDGKEKTNEIDLQIQIEPSIYTDEKFALYKKYQIAVHNDKEEEVTQGGFERFLVETPLMDDSKDRNGGSFHHLYRLNGKLISVGVVDIVPSGMSSVYCFYDPEYRDLVLGKYVALKEIEYCQKNHLEYYYMGFYIHSCEKMRYKGEYAPSELRCPTTHEWIPLADCIAYLDKYKFTPLQKQFVQQRDEIEAKYADVPAGESAAVTKKRKSEALKSLLFVNPALPAVTELNIQIGDHEGLHVQDLTKQGQQIVKQLLIEWMENCGEQVSRSAIVEF